MIIENPWDRHLIFDFMARRILLCTKIRRSAEAYKNAATWKVFKYIVPINDIDGITSPKVPIYNYQLFDLQGRPVQGSPKHGMYIQNGKKVMR